MPLGGMWRRRNIADYRRDLHGLEGKYGSLGAGAVNVNGLERARDFASRAVALGGAMGVAAVLGGAPAVATAAIAGGMQRVSQGAASAAPNRKMAELLDHALVGNLQAHSMFRDNSRLNNGTQLVLERVFGGRNIFDVWNTEGYGAVQKIENYNQELLGHNRASNQTIPVEALNAAMADFSLVALNDWSKTRLVGGSVPERSFNKFVAHHDFGPAQLTHLTPEEREFYDGIISAQQAADRGYAGAQASMFSGMIGMGIGAWALKSTMAESLNRVAEQIERSPGTNFMHQLTVQARGPSVVVGAKGQLFKGPDPLVGTTVGAGGQTPFSVNLMGNQAGIIVHSLGAKGVFAQGMTNAQLADAFRTVAQAAQTGTGPAWALAAIPALMDLHVHHQEGVPLPPDFQQHPEAESEQQNGYYSQQQNGYSPYGQGGLNTNANENSDTDRGVDEMPMPWNRTGRPAPAPQARQAQGLGGLMWDHMIRHGLDQVAEARQVRVLHTALTESHEFGNDLFPALHEGVKPLFEQAHNANYNEFLNRIGTMGQISTAPEEILERYAILDPAGNPADLVDRTGAVATPNLGNIDQLRARTGGAGGQTRLLTADQKRGLYFYAFARAWKDARPQVKDGIVDHITHASALTIDQLRQFHGL